MSSGMFHPTCKALSIGYCMVLDFEASGEKFKTMQYQFVSIIIMTDRISQMP